MRVRKKYQVFISSTFEDLHQERQAVTWALLKARLIPVGMEAFSATDDRGWKTITATIDDSDYYILIIAGKLGSIDEASRQSWTQKEYEYAQSKGIPVLSFVRVQEMITKDKLELDASRAALLSEFIKDVENNHHREQWTDQADLISRVSTALSNHIQDDEHEGTDRPGWYRGDHLPASVEALDELARLSKENSRLRTELALHTAERPRVELHYQSELVDRQLTLRVHRVNLVATTPNANPYRFLASIRTGPSPDEVAEKINKTVWFQFDLRNAGVFPARSLRIEFHVSPAADVEIYPASMQIVPLRDKRRDSTAHVYIDQYHVRDGIAVLVQRMKDLNPGDTEQLRAFGISVPDDFSPKQFNCRVRVTDEGGALLDSTFVTQLGYGRNINVTEDELESHDGKVAQRVIEAT